MDMSSRKTILLVDDESLLLNFLAKHLSKYLNPKGVKVLTATNAKDAVNILSGEPVDVVATDYQMPGYTGLDLLYRIRSQWPGAEILIMTGYCDDEVRELAGKNGCRHIFEKPFDLSKFKEAIVDILAKKEENQGFAGIVKSVNLTDLIQMFCLDGASKFIRVRNEKEEGCILIDSGDIVHASCGDIKGVDAFYRILSWRTGSFETADPPLDPELNIFQSWQFLLLDGARQTDENQGDIT